MVVLAGGQGSRFGSPKQLAEVDGESLLARVLTTLDGIGERQVVVLGAAAEAVAAVVPEGRWETVVCADWQAGVGASLRAGMEVVGEAEEVLIALADLPWLEREAALRLLSAAADGEAEAYRAFDGETPAHPVLIRGAMIERARHAPDAGLGPVLREARTVAVDCAGLGVARDVDRPADLGS